MGGPRRETLRLQSEEAEAHQQVERANGELGTLHRDNKEAALIRQERDELRQSKSVLRAKRDSA